MSTPAPSTDPAAHDGVVTVTVLGTSDVHARVLSFDYVTDAPYADGGSIGFAQLSTLISQVRRARGPERCLTLDCGDTIEGTPLAYYFARQQPITDGVTEHPVAAAMNVIGYDAAAIGNHEFNYGLDVLAAFSAQAHHPLLAANVLVAANGKPAYGDWVLRTLETPAGPVTVGILGLVTPGCAIWDRGHFADGGLTVDGLVERAAVVVPALKAAGADVVVVCSHSGADLSSSYGSALPWPEHASGLLAEQVPGIDAILVGHAHAEIPQRLVTGPDGRQVVLSEPGRWGHKLSVIDLDLSRVDGAWQVVSARSELLDPASCAPDDAVVEAVSKAHETVRRYVNSPIGTATAAMSAGLARVQDSPVLQLVNHVQGATVAAALAGTEYAEVPVLAAAAAFNARAVIPAGEITVRDVAGLYNYDNTLVAVLVDGEQVRAYLEHSARYYRPANGPGPYHPGDLTNAVTATAPSGLPDYNLDVVAGLTGTLDYEIDICRAVGDRIVRLDYDGSPVTDQQRFVLAVNNYRQSGGGGYPAVAAAPVLWDAQVEVREAILDWVRAAGTLDAEQFATVHWRLLADGEPIEFVPA